MPTQTTIPRKSVIAEGERRNFPVTNQVKEFIFTMAALHRILERTGQTTQKCSLEAIGRKDDATLAGRLVHQEN